eukprot:13276916-Alexandrium_andersonii.AAC.1
MANEPRKRRDMNIMEDTEAGQRESKMENHIAEMMGLMQNMNTSMMAMNQRVNNLEQRSDGGNTEASFVMTFDAASGGSAASAAGRGPA